ncbi:MAG: type II pantothenate kinase [Sporolactobacillus sp.]
MSAEQKVGIDAGGTLIKLAVSGRQTDLHLFPSEAPQQCMEWLSVHAPTAELCLTGGQASQFSTVFGRAQLPILAEFDALVNGTRYLLEQEDGTCPKESFILVNVGTGTSIHHVCGQQAIRVGGSGVGGGTIIGLSSLILGISNYRTIVELSAQGKRDAVDLTVGHIYAGATPPIPGDLTASNFGLVAELSHATDCDKAAGIVGLVAETVTSMAILAAETVQTKRIVFIGTTFLNNPLMRSLSERYSRFCGKQPRYLKNGHFSGALGAMLHLLEH